MKEKERKRKDKAKIEVQGQSITKRGKVKSKRSEK
jgi:hypothetical protein